MIISLVSLSRWIVINWLLLIQGGVQILLSMYCKDPKLKLTQVCAVIRQVYGALTVFDAMQHSTEEHKRNILITRP